MTRLQTQIIHQPFDGQLHSEISKLVESTRPRFDNLRIAVAYARSSGFACIEDALNQAKARGKVLFAVGLQEGRTSYQALEYLLKSGIATFIVHDSRPDHAFHTKFYELKGKNNAAILIGSNNLTKGGLAFNYETSVLLKFDLAKRREGESFRRLEQMLDTYFTPSPWVKQLDKNLLEELKKYRLVTDEKTERRQRRRTQAKVVSRIFGMGLVFVGAPFRQLRGVPSGSRLAFTLTNWDCRPQNEIQVPSGARTFFPRVGRNYQRRIRMTATLPSGQQVREQSVWWHRPRQHQFRLRSPSLVRGSSASAEDILLIEFLRPPLTYRGHLIKKDSKLYKEILDKLSRRTRGKRWQIF